MTMTTTTMTTTRTTATAWTTVVVALALGGAAACTRPGEQRALDEDAVGVASSQGATVEVVDGLAAIRSLTPGHLELWGQAPALELDLTVDAAAAGTWELRFDNAMPDAALAGPAAVTIADLGGPRPTVRVFEVEVPAGTHRLRLAPPDADDPAPFRVAAMADIQTALPEVDDVFARIAADPTVRFVVSMGDLTERGHDDEYALFEEQLEVLGVPYFTTLGNHELWSPASAFRDRYGRASFQFVFKDVAFTFADSGDAGIDPLVHQWIDGWLAAARDRVHLFLTHFPPIDPSGSRAGGFRSRLEGHDLLERLAAGGVDLTLYGHVHTYVQFDNAGIPAFISGGGGARPERWDGIGRHFLL
ncbi:MAG: metallophosphoesterase, partial [Myxococcales bacterium]|nr:metallophosphoesterase [Myxococcales bacterium]